MALSTAEIKAETKRLYDSLPMDEEERKKCLDVRDKIIELNYSFFGYIAKSTFINNNSVTYDDKLQSALLHFCEIWWKYGMPEYRQDLSFTVFFKLRVGEMIERELNEVKYSIRRSLCMEVGQQVGKKWGAVKYEDLAKCNLPIDKMNSLKAIFGTLYFADLETHMAFMEAPPSTYSEFDNPSTKFHTVTDLCMYEMITREEPLTEEILSEMSDIYNIDIKKLRVCARKATDKLYKKLHASLDAKL